MRNLPNTNAPFLEESERHLREAFHYLAAISLKVLQEFYKMERPGSDFRHRARTTTRLARANSILRPIAKMPSFQQQVALGDTEPAAQQAQFGATESYSRLDTILKHIHTPMDKAALRRPE